MSTTSNGPVVGATHGDGTLSVRVARSIRGEPLLERDLDALNMASRRPTPFNGRGYLQAFLDHDEFGGPGQEPRLLSVVENERLIGFLPLRRREARALGRTEALLEFFVAHDSDRPDLVARPEDEERCAAAVWRHLLGPGRDWHVLELRHMEPCSPLLPKPGRAIPGGFSRVVDGPPTAIIPTVFADVGAWYKTLTRGWRHTTSRLGRRFLSSGQAELVTCRDPRGGLPLLELYLDVERRSWKRRHGLGRHPARLGLHRELCSPDQDLALSFQFLLLDGVPVSGFIFAEFVGSLYGMEICYDEAYAALGPGHLMSIASVHEAIARGRPSLNLFADFAYYKRNWGADALPTRTLQVFRTGSAHWLKARLGDVKRAVAGSWRKQRAGRFNQVKKKVEADEGGSADAPDAASGAAFPPARDAERALAARTFAQLEADGVAVERLSGPSLLAVIPFNPPKAPKAGRS